MKALTVPTTWDGPGATAITNEGPGWAIIIYKPVPRESFQMHRALVAFPLMSKGRRRRPQVHHNGTTCWKVGVSYRNLVFQSCRTRPIEFTAAGRGEKVRQNLGKTPFWRAARVSWKTVRRETWIGAQLNSKGDPLIRQILDIPNVICRRHVLEARSALGLRPDFRAPT